MLCSLALSPSNSIKFNELPWHDAFLKTPKHAVRTAWNKKAIEKTCEREKQQLFICPAKYRIGEHTLSVEEHIHLRTHEIEIAIGMKVFVTYNLETELDIMNGGA